MTAKRKAPPAPAAKKAATHSLLPPGFLGVAKDVVIITGVLSALGLGTIIGLSRDLLDSGPLPVPSRAEVAAVAKTLEQTHREEDQVHQNLTAQLKDLSELTQAQIADTRTSRLRSLGALIDQAKANLDKEPTAANRDILAALLSQQADIQADIMKATNK